MNRSTIIAKARKLLAERSRAKAAQLKVTVVPIGQQPPADDNQHQMILVMTE